MSGPYATYGRPGVSHSVAYTATAAKTTAPISNNIFLVRVVLTTAGFIKIGPNAGLTATSSDMYLPGDVPEYFAVRAGEHISAIRLSASGTMYITEMTH